MNSRETFATVKNHELSFVRDAENLSYLSRKKLTVYYSTPLENISFEESVLIKYSVILTRKLAKFGLTVEVEKCQGLSISIPSIKVKVSDKETVVYESLFVTLAESNTWSNGLYLPLLFVIRFKIKSILNIHSAVERVFKCRLSLLDLSEVQSHWLMGISINETLKRNTNEGIRLTLVLPSLSNVTIDVFYDKDSFKMIWEAFHKKNSDIIRIDELANFFSQILEHAKNTYAIDFGVFSVRAISLVGVQLIFKPKFQIKISKPEIIFSLMSYILADCIQPFL